MDFLLLLPRSARVVLELEGIQHYTEGESASPRLYSDMAAEDRRLRLRGYEVYWFGGYELNHHTGVQVLRDFFDELIAKHLDLSEPETP